MIIGPSDTPYEGGFFPAKLEFPDDFPNSPPVMTFTGPMLHPNGEPLHVLLLSYFFLKFTMMEKFVSQSCIPQGRINSMSWYMPCHSLFFDSFKGKSRREMETNTECRGNYRVSGIYALQSQ
jgi:hypothetical protein